jgi:hypothetical protein
VTSGDPGPPRGGPGAESFDPLRLCVFTSVALLAWLAGPLVVAGFALLGLLGYLRARRAGLRRSRCLLRDTRLVIGYLGLVLVASLVAVAWPLLAPALPG